jgi:hypothetical protein
LVPPLVPLVGAVLLTAVVPVALTLAEGDAALDALLAGLSG